MKKGTIIPLVLGLILGVVAIKLFLSGIQKAKAGAQAAVVPAVVTVDDIPATAEEIGSGVRRGRDHASDAESRRNACHPVAGAR